MTESTKSKIQKLKENVDALTTTVVMRINEINRLLRDIEQTGSN